LSVTDTLLKKSVIIGTWAADLQFRVGIIIMTYHGNSEEPQIHTLDLVIFIQRLNVMLLTSQVYQTEQGCVGF
jgi:hypothetical protein